MMRNVLAAAVLAIAVAGGAGASAAPITLSVQYEIYSVSGAATGSFSVGQTVSGYLTYDSATPGVNYDPTASGNPLPNYRFYAGALTDYALTVNGITYTESLGGRRGWVADNYNGLDRFLLEDTAPVASGGLTPSFLNVQFGDYTQAALSSAALPDPFPAADFLGACCYQTLSIIFGGNGRIDAHLTSLTNPSAVPEPWSLALFGAALAGLGLVMRVRQSA